MQRAAIFLVLFVLLALPGVSDAQFFGPIVPQCDGAGSGTSACQACHFVQLGQNILFFLVSIGVFLAGIVFAAGGFKMITAGGNESKIKVGRDMLSNAIVGFVIVLAAWLLIDTILKVMLPTQGSGESAIGIVGNLGPWNSIQCASQPRFVDTVGGGVIVQDPAGTNTGTPTGSGTCNVINSGPCSVSSLTGSFGNQAQNASQICNAESAGNVASLSLSDRLRSSGDSFSVGLYQINLTVHDLHGCGSGGSTLNCTDAFDGRNYDAVIVNRTLYNECVTAAQDATCNINNAVRIQNNRGSWADWSTASTCNII